ncbi:CotH kinase family protein [Verrucomicrobium sp. BvORR106]|uniref:CotH kinase family protein n=1 Tax=Verrucomicrobium sp. BvORR106 TaxID=1403819 RepID=UPI00056DD4A3|nr:CotH kinase family protein [Verrucomicrobium sp. BvORR106]
MAFPRRRSLLVVPCAMLLVGMAILVEFFPLEGLEAYEDRSAPALVLGRDAVTSRNAALIRMGLLQMSHKYCEPWELAADSKEAVALFKQPCPAPPKEVFDQKSPPSTALLGSRLATLPADTVIVSLVCRSSELFDPDHGIVTHPQEHNRDAERPAWFSAWQNSRLLIESPVGLRVHGGHSRTLPAKSFALRFREEYGGRGTGPAGLFFGADAPPVRELVLTNADHPSRFNAALATEIAALAGCKVSRSVPAIVFLNGTEIRSPFFIYEHQSADFVEGRFGLADVDWVRLKSREAIENEAYVEWRRWIRRPRNPILMEEEAAKFNLQDLNAWVLTMSFTATGDNNQGAYFRDRRNPQAVWQSLVWDMDWSFDEGVHQTAHGPLRPSKDSFDVLLGDRARLFNRLFDHNAEYREAYQQFARERLSTQLSRETVLKLMDRYESLARRHPSSSPRLMAVMQSTRAFLERRHAEYDGLLEERVRKALNVSREPRPLAER